MLDVRLPWYVMPTIHVWAWAGALRVPVPSAVFMAAWAARRARARIRK